MDVACLTVETSSWLSTSIPPQGGVNPHHHMVFNCLR